MNPSIALYILPLVVGSVAAALLAIAAWRRRVIRGATIFSVLLALIAFWSAAEVVEILLPDLASKQDADRLQYISVELTPILWLLFGVIASGRARWFARFGWLIPSLIGAITLGIIATGDPSGLLWPTTGLDSTGPIPIIRVTHGPWWWVNTIGIYVMFVAGAALLVRHGESTSRDRTSTALTNVGAALGLLGGIVNALGLNPPGVADATPYGVTFGAIAIALGHFRFQILDGFFGVLPIAHQMVVAGLIDGVVVLDADGRVLYANPAARRIFSFGSDLTIGRHLDPRVRAALNLDETDADGTAAHQDVAIALGGATAHYERQVTALRRGHTTLGLLIVLHDVTERKRREDRFARLAASDPLTGLANRRTLEMAVDFALTRAAQGQSSALLYADADGFKVVNDTLGHQAGDSVLAALAQTIGRQIRDGDLLARVGGDEFAVLLAGLNAEQALPVADRICQSVAADPFTVDGHRFNVTLSVGLVDLARHRSLESALRAADAAMYAAKREGRNRVFVGDAEVFSSRDDSRAKA